MADRKGGKHETDNELDFRVDGSCCNYDDLCKRLASYGIYQTLNTQPRKVDNGRNSEGKAEDTKGDGPLKKVSARAMVKTWRGDNSSHCQVAATEGHRPRQS